MRVLRQRRRSCQRSFSSRRRKTTVPGGKEKEGLLEMLRAQWTDDTAIVRWSVRNLAQRVRNATDHRQESRGQPAARCRWRLDRSNNNRRRQQQQQRENHGEQASCFAPRGIRIQRCGALSIVLLRKAGCAVAPFPLSPPAIAKSLAFCFLVFLEENVPVFRVL